MPIKWKSKITKWRRKRKKKIYNLALFRFDCLSVCLSVCVKRQRGNPWLIFFNQTNHFQSIIVSQIICDSIISFRFVCLFVFFLFVSCHINLCRVFSVFQAAHLTKRQRHTSTNNLRKTRKTEKLVLCCHDFDQI